MPHGYTHILVIGREPMINTRRHDDQITLLKPDPDPVVALAPDVKVARAIQDVADLLVFVQMLVEEGLHFFLVDGAHGGGRNGDLIAVLVLALGREGVHVSDVRIVVVEDAKLGEVGGVYGAA